MGDFYVESLPMRQLQQNRDRLTSASSPAHAHSPITSRSLRMDSSNSGKRSSETVRPFLEG